jgi:hypothetical protein
MTAPQISPLPTPPSRSQSPDTFSADADAFLGALPDFQEEANDQADYLDALAIDVTADAAAAEAAAAIAAGAANYQGDYSAGTTYQIGESVSYTGRRYVAKTVNTGVTPADGANWFLINDGDVLGPVSATDNGLAAFDGTTGKMIKAAGTVSVAQGGTGATSLTANAVLVGNGTSAVSGIAAGASGNLLTSNGTSWASASPPASGFSNLVVFSASGTFTIPAGITKIKATIVGGGGSGGGANGVVAGGGGAGGGAAIKILSGLTSGNTLSVTIGAGGTGTSSAGNSGGTTSLASGTQTISTVSATGGAGGSGHTFSNTEGSLGGVGSGGDLNIRGGAGQGGGSGSSGGWGVGCGGGSILGGGAPGRLFTAASGGAYGGGGGSPINSVTANGGNGAAGVLIIEY